MTFHKITESASNFDHLELLSTHEILAGINSEDLTVPKAVGKALFQIEKVVEKAVEQIKKGGRLFYIGAGTSGRLGILDASECPPTFGVEDDLIIGLIAGGDTAIRKAVENAEDDPFRAETDLRQFQINNRDMVVGIAASGTTPYVLGGIKFCKENDIPTACITCNPGSPLVQEAHFPIEVVVGPEFITGSSRMKGGTAQKLVLNMISTAVMIKLGRVKGNKMVDMKLSNDKLVLRAKNMLMEELSISESEAGILLNQYGSVRKAINNFKK